MSSPLRTAQAADSDSESASRGSSPTRDPVSDSFDLFGCIPSAFLSRDLPSVHGPALSSDDPNQIYDDFSGELARNRPSSQYLGLDDEDNDNHSDDLLSDNDTLDLPESEGLLGQYDAQFAEEQRRLAPHNSLIAADEDDWWPWRSKQECLLDLMSGFPRACFSEKELNATRWYAKKNGVSMQPTIKQVKNHRQDILNTAGLETKLLEGKLGNSFAVNDWFKILEHEFANPLVRPKLHLYPEDSGEKLEEARQAEKWKEEVDGNISAPMARGNGGKDYYVEEVCFAKLNDDRAVGPVMPMRWFTRNGIIMSTAHPLRLTPSKLAFIIDGSDDACLEILLENYFLNVRDLEDLESQRHYGIPPPSSISGIFCGPRRPLEEWNQPPVNQWRVKANGRRILPTTHNPFELPFVICLLPWIPSIAPAMLMAFSAAVGDSFPRGILMRIALVNTQKGTTLTHRGPSYQAPSSLLTSTLASSSMAIVVPVASSSKSTTSTAQALAETTAGFRKRKHRDLNAPEPNEPLKKVTIHKVFQHRANFNRKKQSSRSTKIVPGSVAMGQVIIVTSDADDSGTTFGVPRSVDIARYETRHLAVNGVHKPLSFNKNWDCLRMDKWLRTLFPVYFAHMDKHYPLDAMHKFQWAFLIQDNRFLSLSPDLFGHVDQLFSVDTTDGVKLQCPHIQSPPLSGTIAPDGNPTTSPTSTRWKKIPTTQMVAEFHPPQQSKKAAGKAKARSPFPAQSVFSIEDSKDFPMNPSPSPFHLSAPPAVPVMSVAPVAATPQPHPTLGARTSSLIPPSPPRSSRTFGPSNLSIYTRHTSKHFLAWSPSDFEVDTFYWSRPFDENV
ncbi:hypothetical protein B0H14DRAFT_2587418 [Mycena olivaceomarginata]|nr:hypothetical protein B0H14DRAFT_2587418 [Mycena olivaceomarginata]